MFSIFSVLKPKTNSMQPIWLCIWNIMLKIVCIWTLCNDTSRQLISKAHLQTFKYKHVCSNSRKKMLGILLPIGKKTFYYLIMWLNIDFTFIESFIFSYTPSHVLTSTTNCFTCNNHYFVDTFII